MEEKWSIVERTLLPVYKDHISVEQAFAQENLENQMLLLKMLCMLCFDIKYSNEIETVSINLPSLFN